MATTAEMAAAVHIAQFGAQQAIEIFGEYLLAYQEAQKVAAGEIWESIQTFSGEPDLAYRVLVDENHPIQELVRT